MGMIKKETNKHINKIPGNPNLYERLKKFNLQNCSSPYGSTVNITEKTSPKKAKNINTLNRYNLYIPSLKILSKEPM